MADHHSLVPQITRVKHRFVFKKLRWEIARNPRAQKTKDSSIAFGRRMIVILYYSLNSLSWATEIYYYFTKQGPHLMGKRPESISFEILQ
jgi:hypothetical protein